MDERSIRWRERLNTPMLIAAALTVAIGRMAHAPEERS
jgi:hypothetical protein